ncbi:hypothetical protein E2C01_095985 [Portunus trituberculatus]|uniref:Uncharacterized protein n=1 Tax=Portunus trituberculatus TaxID=210409 RepID=A0A5B7K0I0_PORTR|nr:hypothetical protein [Portunus trituberculatus]
MHLAKSMTICASLCIPGRAARLSPATRTLMSSKDVLRSDENVRFNFSPRNDAHIMSYEMSVTPTVALCADGAMNPRGSSSSTEYQATVIKLAGCGEPKQPWHSPGKTQPACCRY